MDKLQLRLDPPATTGVSPAGDSRPITQENLPAAIESGLITQEQVAEIWKKTEFLSAQTPIEWRVAMINLGLDKVDPLSTTLLTVLMDMRATLNRDENKFAHLVAGTEVIVKSLQKVNPLVRRLERQEMMIDSLSEQLNNMQELLTQVLKQTAPQDPNAEHYGDQDEAELLAAMAADAIIAQEAEPTTEPYDGNVGSAWDPKNPAKEAIELPTAKAEHEERKRQFEEMIDRHSSLSDQRGQFRERVLKNS